MKVFFAFFALLALAFAESQSLYRPEPRIINGQKATLGEFPYQVGLYVTEDGRHGFKCGGALISPKTVLTAAHCFDRFKTGIASLATTRFNEGVKIPFSRVNVHEEYDPTSYQIKNDIALVYLDSPVPIDGKTIDVIPLDETPITKHEMLRVSGFGQVQDVVDNDDLYHAELRTILPFTCSMSWLVSDDVVCCKSWDGEATCMGDSGGALVRNWPDNATHVGIVSYGPDPCGIDKPLVFARTSYFIEWIKERIE